MSRQLCESAPRGAPNRTLGRALILRRRARCQQLSLGQCFSSLEESRTCANSHEGAQTMTEKTTIWTIGHSTRSIEELIEALKSFKIDVLVDVRSFPGSRRYPHFNKESLEVSLPGTDIDYLHFPELG